MTVSPQNFVGLGETAKALSPEPVLGRPRVSSSFRVPELDGLRGVAILLVLIYHGVFDVLPSSRLLARLMTVGSLGWSGVDLFFVLSGFLIGGILLDARLSPNYFRTFYWRRAYRILPIYLFAMVLFSLRFVHPAARPLGGFSMSVIPWLSYFTFTQNLWMAALGSFGPGAMAATWSLAVEEQFYLTAPLIVRKVRPERLAPILLGVVAAAPVLRTVLFLTFQNGRFADYVLMPCRADALSLGMLTAWLTRSASGWNFVLSHRRALKITAAGLFAGVVGLSLRETGFLAPLMVTVGYSWLALFYTSVLLVTISGSGERVQRALRSRSLIWLGTVSYFTYLLHLPLMEGARRVLGLRFTYASGTVQFWGGWLGIGLTLLLATLSWKYVEKPLLGRAHSYRY
jgi:peptidoglycan/LPS O-acetylase OafA/YrhL